jgi:hypothetical protein
VSAPPGFAWGTTALPGPKNIQLTAFERIASGGTTPVSIEKLKWGVHQLRENDSETENI